MPVDKLASAITAQGEMIMQGMASLGEGFQAMAAAHAAPRKKTAIGPNGKTYEITDEPNFSEVN
jgi:hypothetical protein